jgi:FkbM family methyltransferase
VLDGIRRSIESAKNSAHAIGWRWAIAERMYRKFGIDEMTTRLPGLHPVHIRVGTSDIYEFNHLLGRQQVPMVLPYQPEIIVDAGANVGYSALRFQQEFPGAKIIALEPDSRNFSQLQKNCGRYPNIIAEHAALWSHRATLHIIDPDVPACAFQVTEDPNGDISAKSIGDVMAEHALPRIDLLKIDIEGSEIEVFADVESWRPKVGMILVELHDRMRPGCTDAVHNALSGWFDYHGILDEYAFFVRQR